MHSILGSADLDDQIIFVYGGWARTSHDGTVDLIITKLAADTGLPLYGVSFQLWTNIHGVATMVNSGTTDLEGKIIFYPLNIHRSYWLVESDPAFGYMDIGRATVVDVGGNSTLLSEFRLRATDDDEDIYLTIYNHREPGAPGTGFFSRINDEVIGTAFVSIVAGALIAGVTFSIKRFARR